MGLVYTLLPSQTFLLQILSRDYELEHLCRLLHSTMLQIQPINMTAHLIPTLLSPLPSSPLGTAAFKWQTPASHALIFKSLVDRALCTGKRNISWICLRRILLHSLSSSVILMQHWPDNKILNIEYELLKSQMSLVWSGSTHHPF